MASRGPSKIWLLAALAVALAGAGLIWRHRAHARPVTFLDGDPQAGARLLESKGCLHCHAVNGQGGRVGPDLAAPTAPRSNMSEVVAGMWNHAPQMWERMAQEKISPPELSREEVAQVFAYLYTIRYVDEAGDAEHGERLFRSLGCVRCHAIRGQGGHQGPDLASIGGVDTPIVWAQEMWNHAPAMEAKMQQVGVVRPRFEGAEMNDLLAYVRKVCDGPRSEYKLLPASASRGAELFAKKSCIACHSVKGKGGKVGPELGPQHRLPPTLAQFAGEMWNHSPEMYRAMRERGIDRPSFENQEMADVMAYLSSLRYFEPTGTAVVGSAVFSQRGCAHCHGSNAEGTPSGPVLRGRGDVYNSISLATALWSHGPEMYRQTQKLSVPWPKLEESDLGDLIAFLNAPSEKP